MVRKEMGQSGQTGQVGWVFLTFASNGIKSMMLVCSLKFWTLVVSKGVFLRSYSCSTYY